MHVCLLICKGLFGSFNTAQMCAMREESNLDKHWTLDWSSVHLMDPCCYFQLIVNLQS